MGEVDIKNIQKSINKIMTMMIVGLNLLVQPVFITFLINNHIRWEVILIISGGLCIYCVELSMFACTYFLEIILVKGFNAIASKNRGYRIFVFVWIIIFIPLLIILTVTGELEFSNIFYLIYINTILTLRPWSFYTNNIIMYDDWTIYGTNISNISDVVEYNKKSTVYLFKKRQRLTIKLKNKKQIILIGKEHEFDQLTDYIELHKYIEKYYTKVKAECRNN